MSDNSIQFTVLFDNSFWIGILERYSAEGYSVAKTIFGAEPTDNEVFYYLLSKFDKLSFSKPSADNRKERKLINPKRKLRTNRKLMAKQPSVSKAHLAIKQMQENNVSIKKTKNKLMLEEARQRRFLLKQLKKKQKHKGR